MTFSLVYATPLLQHQAQLGLNPAVSPAAGAEIHTKRPASRRTTAIERLLRRRCSVLLVSLTMLARINYTLCVIATPFPAGKWRTVMCVCLSVCPRAYIRNYSPVSAFSALTLLVGRQEWRPACKN